MIGINIKNVCKITFVIIGTIIGAGFASGQEIFTFFNKYGVNRTYWYFYVSYFNGFYNIQDI